MSPHNPAAGSAVEVFVDEARRSDYVLSAAVVPAIAIAQARKTLRSMKPPNKNRIHLQSEGRQSRQRIVAEFCRQAPIQEAHLWIAKIGGRPEREVRDACFRELVPEAVGFGAKRIVVESCSQDVQDKRVMTDALDKLNALPQTRVEVLAAAAHELLWAADIVAWCYGAGGRHRAQISKFVHVHNVY